MNQFNLLFLITLFKFGSSIKCCSTIIDYYQPSGNCWNNPDGEANQTQILQRWGATVKENYLTTDDGYIILMTTAVFNKTQATPILMGHGQHHNSDSFLTNHNKSLVYHLLQLGFEVNLINFRASKYSRKHVTLFFNEDPYWNFDFEEMGIYDLRKCIHSVYNRTHEKSIYIGYSMGTAIGYIYLSMFSEEASNFFKAMVSLGPVATLTDARSITRYGAPIWYNVRSIFKLLFGNYLPRIQSVVEFWAPTPSRWYIWDLIFRLPIIGHDFGQIDPLYKPVQTLLFDDSIPIGVFDHFADISMARKFIRRNYGTIKNQEIYGSKSPPVYDLLKISISVAMYVGKADYFADPTETVPLYGNLTTNAQCGYYYIARDEWHHGDFIWAKDIVPLLVKPVLKKIKEFQEDICIQ